MTRASVHLSNVRRISPLVMALKALTLSAERITIRSREAMDVSFRYRMILRLSVDGAKEVIHVSCSIGGTQYTHQIGGHLHWRSEFTESNS
jgi:hypothetical protein